MNVPIPDPSKNEGSSLVLAILVGIAAVVIIALMMQTSTKGGGKKSGTEVQQDAIAETLDVFNKFDSAMENSSGEAKAGNVQKDGAAPPENRAGRPKQPMHLTTPPTPSDKEGKKGDGVSGPQASIFFDGFGTDGAKRTFSKQLESAYGALDVITGFNLADKEEPVLNEQAEPTISPNIEKVTNVNSASIVPEPVMSETILPTPNLPEVNPRARSGVESAVSRLVEFTADSELDVALREAVAVKEGFSATAQVSPVNRLSKPLFSHPSGSFPPKQFDIELKLANPNPKRLSKIRYAINGGEWLVYEGTPINVGPGMKVSAFCQSTDRTWGDSPRESRDFLEQTLSLTPPTIYASALKFDDRANQRITIAVTNPNRYAASRVEYRFGGSPWQVYRESVKIDGAAYSRSGVRVEARVVGVIGVAGRQASESVAIELAPSGGSGVNVTAHAGSRSGSNLEPRNVNLGAPEGPHGYRARSSAQFDFARMYDPDGADRFLLETFEAYRRHREKPEGGFLESLVGDGRWGRLRLIIPDGGGPVDRRFLAGRNAEKSVLDGNGISLFESAGVGSGAYQ